MIKLVASHSEKRSKDYNSTGVSASIELEVANTASANEIQERLHKAYALLRKTIAEEIGKENTVGEIDANHQPEPTHRWKPNGGNGRGGNGNGKGRKNGTATQAQQRAIFAISKAAGMSKTDVVEFIEYEFGKSKSEELTVKEASRAIEFLKAQQT